MLGLTCPRCNKQLDKLADGNDACTSCKVTFTRLGGRVPFLWSEPGSALLDWRNRYNAALAEIEQQATDTAQSPEQATPSTRRRLNHLHAAWSRHHDELTQILDPLNVGAALAKETHLALRTKLPSHHGILSYAPNIHRDWCWGDAENSAVLSCISDALEEVSTQTADIQNILVLGAGAGRLAYDLHNALQPTHTWALDSNPLLCLIGARMSAGEELTFTEFPLAPIGLQDCAVERTLRAPHPLKDIDFVCADALRAPFAGGQFDLVVTPWLLDVIDASLTETLASIHHLTKPGGIWLTHGSVAFTGSRAVNRLSAEELAELSGNNGFDVLHRANLELPYLQSPASRQARQELTYTQVCRRDLSDIQTRAPKHDHLPEWIVGARAPVPLTPGFQTQISTTRIHAFMMSLIDGKRTVRDMAQILEDQRLMPAAQAVQAIQQFLTTMYEEATQMDGRSGGRGH